MLAALALITLVPGCGDNPNTEVDAGADGGAASRCSADNGGCDPLAGCEMRDGVAECGSCPDGYVGTGETSCVDLDECATENGGCAQACSNTVGSFGCSCADGYALSADQAGCDDVDECATDAAGCGQTCTNTEGAFECACGAGFALSADGASCDDIDECALGTDDCDALASCTNTIGGFACGSCPLGYTDDDSGGTACMDINECELGTDGCSALVTCTNIAGGFLCGDCPSGYVDDGASGCVDIDECETANGNCDPLTGCMNTAGGRTCGACPSGYVGTGATGCVDVDECIDGANGGCDVNATCANNTGAPPTCTCDGFYVGDGYTCADDDECADGTNGGCDANAACVNNTGAAPTCTCDAYYMGDGRTCVDVDECGAEIDGCEQDCLNIVGGFTCSCVDGYTLNGDGLGCDDINECLSANGGCDPLTTCTNTDGSHTCGSCPAGYSGNGQDGCVLIECGNGIRQAGEACDQGAANRDVPALEVSVGGVVVATPTMVRRADTAVDFYDFYSASAHTGFEASSLSNIFVYQPLGSEADGEAYLVFVHGVDSDDGMAQGPASLMMAVSGVPAGASVVLSDDAAEFSVAGSTAAGGWSFASNTDGAIMAGLPIPGDWEMTISVSMTGALDTWTFRDDSGDTALDPSSDVTIVARGASTGCRTDCTVPACGDGIWDAGEICADGAY